MRVIIVEDEAPALEKLERYIQKYDPSCSVVARLSSISETVSWLKGHSEDYDLMFLDIQLTDGLSFDIFNQIPIQKPVIFVTAFDEYAIDAFKVNSIDYILKPATFSDVSKALNKLKQLKTLLPSETVSQVSKAFTETKTKDRFLVRLGNHIHSIKTEDIALFFAEGRTVFLITHAGKKYILDYNLERLSAVLDPKTFFRTNRTFIINLNAIDNVIMYSGSRLKVIPKVSLDKDILVSRERVGAFKSWFEGD